MRIYKNITIFAFILTFIFIRTPIASASLNVVTTTSDLASIAKEIGGSLIKVSSLVKGYQDPHYIQPKPSYMVKMNRADLLIYQGLEFEIGWLPVLLEGARNPNILPDQPGYLNASQDILPLEALKEVGRLMGDVHPDGNPHYNLDPQNGFIIAQSIFTKLSELDPENKPQFHKNLKSFNQRLEKKLIQWKSKMSAYRGAEVITYHKLWSYFAKRFDLKIVDTVEIKPGVPPTTRHISHLISAINKNEIKGILKATYFESKFADMVADKTGSTVLSLPAFVGGVPEAKDYFSMFDTIIEALSKVLQPTS